MSRAFGVSASVMVPVAGQPSLGRVIDAIGQSRLATGGVICGPSDDAIAADDTLETLLRASGHQWLAPAAGPAASALTALGELDRFPALLTAGDHALLTPGIVDDFCARVLSASPRYDLIIGLVPYALVREAYPQSRRTVLKFADGRFCGSNLFAIIKPQGLKALSFWQQAEADRKKPWKIARRFGFTTLFRYLFRRLSVEETFQALSRSAGCRIGYVEVRSARAAVDVDSIEDQKLAEEILSRGQ